MIYTNKEECCGCSACSSRCPRHCIKMIDDNDGFSYPSIDKAKCVNCGACESVCPHFPISHIEDMKTVAIGMYAKDSTINRVSSSGGIFSLLAQKILLDGGVVYGATMNYLNGSAQHIRIDDVQELARIVGSKYVQSVLNGIFQMVEKDLKNGKIVLFSGVPCQIKALHLYLREEYSSLFTVEVVCHGVTTPILFKSFIRSIEDKYGMKCINVDFRKKAGSKQKIVSKTNEDTIEIYIPKSLNSFMYFYLQNYALRDSCYECPAKEGYSTADLTLSDFWGGENIAPDLRSKYGCSCVYINTKKGKEIISLIQSDTIFKTVDCSQAIQNNPAYYSSAVKPQEREKFINDIREIPYKNLEEKYYKKPKVDLLHSMFSTLYSIYASIIKRRITPISYGMYIKLCKKQ